MNAPRLIFGVVMVVAASAAELKKPAAVARERDQSMADSPPPLRRDLSLRSQCAEITPPPAAIPSFGPARAPRLGDWTIPRPRLREPLCDAPGYRIPRILPDHMPFGTDLREIDWRTGTVREK